MVAQSDRTANQGPAAGLCGVCLQDFAVNLANSGTAHPTALDRPQVVEAFPSDTSPRFLIRDHDGGSAVHRFGWVAASPNDGTRRRPRVFALAPSSGGITTVPIGFSPMNHQDLIAGSRPGSRQLECQKRLAAKRHC